MKVINLMVGMMVILAITACSPTKYVVKKEIVTVSKPVPYCPAPPEVDTYEYWVDQLTDEDVKDPGKVGQAYKHDMIILRQNDATLRAIIQQYKEISTSFSGVQEQIDNIFKNITDSNNARIEPLTTE